MKHHLKTLMVSTACLFLIGAGGISSAAEDPSTVLAEVGKAKLTLGQFNEQVAELPPQFQMTLAVNPQLREQLLERWVQITLFAEEAKATKMDQDPAFRAKLEDVKNALLAQAFIEKKVEGKVTVTPDEVKAYYEAHKEEFSQPEMVKARHILVRVPSDADAKAWSDAETKVKDIRKQLDKGKDFAELARQYSEDPGSKDRGGDLGFFPKGRMVPEFETAAFALKAGDTSGPVKSPFGYHIIQVQERKDAAVTPFEDISQQVEQRLIAEKQQKLVEQITDELKKKFPVSIHKDRLPKPEAAPQGAHSPVHGAPAKTK